MPLNSRSVTTDFTDFIYRLPGFRTRDVRMMGLPDVRPVSEVSEVSGFLPRNLRRKYAVEFKVRNH
jgi:hypothetical protein